MREGSRVFLLHCTSGRPAEPWRMNVHCSDALLMSPTVAVSTPSIGILRCCWRLRFRVGACRPHKCPTFAGFPHVLPRCGPVKILAVQASGRVAAVTFDTAYLAETGTQNRRLKAFAYREVGHVHWPQGWRLYGCQHWRAATWHRCGHCAFRRH